jgi:hypothetical protein
MTRLTFLSFLALIVAVGAARPARAQDSAGADTLADQLQNKFDPNEAEHAKQKAQQEKAQKKQEKAKAEQSPGNQQNARTVQAQQHAKAEPARQESANQESARHVKPEAKPQQTAKASTENGHHKHWWSMPHLRRKHDDDSALSQAQPKSQRKPNKKAAAARPASKTTKSKQSGKKTGSSATEHRTASGKEHGNSAVATNKPDTKSAAKPHGKTVSAAGHSGKSSHHNCSAADEKNGDCKPEQRQTALATTQQS